MDFLLQIRVNGENIAQEYPLVISDDVAWTWLDNMSGECIHLAVSWMQLYLKPRAQFHLLQRFSVPVSYNIYSVPFYLISVYFIILFEVY